MLIRAALPHDLAVITAIYDHAVRHGTASFELQPPDQKEMMRRYEALLGGGHPYLVAEIEGNKLEIDFEHAGRKKVLDSFVSTDS